MEYFGQDGAEGVSWCGGSGDGGWSAESLGCAGVALGLLTIEHPRTDEWLLCDGVDARTLTAWTHGGAAQDTVFRAAGERGWSQGTAVQTGLRLEGRQPRGDVHAMWVCAPESLCGQQRWSAVFLRGGVAFTPAERERLIATVRQWQACFNQPGERGMSLILAGENERLIHLNPGCQLRMLDTETSPASFLRELMLVIEQRWPETGPDQVRDVAIPYGDGATWATVRFRKPAYEGAGGQTLVELRTLEEGELPAVGLLEDDRVARTLGYLHDRYHCGPRLDELAALAGISAFHFHRVFAKQVGVSPKQYQLMKQLQMAKWRLRCSREPIGAIAEGTGFANHAHFTATFRRVLDVSPTEYRASTS